MALTTPSFGRESDDGKARDRQQALAAESKDVGMQFTPIWKPPEWMNLPPGWEVLGECDEIYLIWQWASPGTYSVAEVDEYDAPNLQPQKLTRLERDRMSANTMKVIFMISAISAALIFLMKGCDGVTPRAYAPDAGVKQRP